MAKANLLGLTDLTLTIILILSLSQMTECRKRSKDSERKGRKKNGLTLQIWKYRLNDNSPEFVHSVDVTKSEDMSPKFLAE